MDRNAGGGSKEWQLFVVPYVGTWIEISNVITAWKRDTVVPYVGTWIEIVVSVVR